MQSKAIVNFSVAGYFIALVWIGLFSQRVQWPRGVEYLVNFTFPAVMLMREVYAGRGFAFVYIVLPLANAVIYGLVGYFVFRVMRMFGKSPG